METRKVTRGRVWIAQYSRMVGVLSEVGEHVDERVSHRTRRAERMDVKAIRPNGPAPHEQAVDLASQPDYQRAKAAAQVLAIARFHQEVNVVRLHTEMNDAKAVNASVAKAGYHQFHGWKYELRSQALQLGS